MTKIKIYGLSDVHIDSHPKNQELWHLLYQFCMESPPDLLLVAGDLAETERGWANALELFKKTSFQKAILPGNHDLWCRDSTEPNSLKKYHESLPRISLDQGWGYLPSQPLKIQDLGIVGSCCWYDYSLMPSDHPFCKADFLKRQRRGRQWMDGVFCRWPDFDPMDQDPLITDYFYFELEKNLKLISEKGCDKIFLVTHFPFYQDLLSFTGNNWDFEYFGAFMGSKKYLKLLEQFPIRYHLCGHLHSKAQFLWNQTQVYLSPVGTLKEWGCIDPKSRLDSILLQLQVETETPKHTNFPPRKKGSR
jgi:predicted phosphohydrolase